MKLIIISIILIKLATSQHTFVNRVNHMEYYKNRTRPSKAFNSFSVNYFNQNSIRDKNKERVQCGTRTVDFTLRRGKIVGGSEAPYGAFPWQVRSHYDFLNFKFIISRQT